MNLKSIVLTGLLLCLCFNNILQAQVQTPRYIQMSEKTSAFYEYLPQGYPEAGQKYPLLLFVHGYGETGPGTAASLPLVLRHGPPKLIAAGSFPTSFTVNNQTHKFIVISPQFIGFPSVNDINNSLNYLIANYAVDINRIYLTGLSMGGAAAWYYPGYNQYFANRIAATVPICGATDASPSYANNIALANLPVWATHNSGDPTVSVNVTNTLVSYINTNPSPPNPLAKKTIFLSSSHDAWTQTYSPSFKENGLNIYEWMLQYQRNLTVLPVSGLELNAVLAGNKQVNLNWTTTSEINSQGFSVLRSNDGNTFNSIGFVASTGTNGGGATYSFTDNAPLQGKNCYRLEVKDNDGQKSFSDIKIVEPKANISLSFYPNPAQNVLNIQSPYLYKNAQLRISNAAGQNVLQQSLNGTGNFAVKVSALTPGVYYGKIIADDKVERFKFIKE